MNTIDIVLAPRRHRSWPSRLGDANVLNGIRKILGYNYRGRTTEVRGGFSTRIARTPAARAQATSLSRSPIIHDRARSRSSWAAAMKRLYGPGLRSSEGPLKCGTIPSGCPYE